MGDVDNVHECEQVVGRTIVANGTDMRDAHDLARHIGVQACWDYNLPPKKKKKSGFIWMHDKPQKQGCVDA